DSCLHDPAWPRRRQLSERGGPPGAGGRVGGLAGLAVPRLRGTHPPQGQRAPDLLRAAPGALPPLREAYLGALPSPRGAHGGALRRRGPPLRGRGAARPLADAGLGAGGAGRYGPRAPAPAQRDSGPRLPGRARARPLGRAGGVVDVPAGGAGDRRFPLRARHHLPRPHGHGRRQDGRDARPVSRPVRRDGGVYRGLHGDHRLRRAGRSRQAGARKRPSLRDLHGVRGARCALRRSPASGVLPEPDRGCL
ncbi:MAG: Leader peptidase (Prepilin peptidase) / N-methyltransferase, partial [uncultured Rubrobacteraceae bacterium]